MRIYWAFRWIWEECRIFAGRRWQDTVTNRPKIAVLLGSFVLVGIAYAQVYIDTKKWQHETTIAFQAKIDSKSLRRSVVVDIAY